MSCLFESEDFQNVRDVRNVRSKIKECQENQNKVLATFKKILSSSASEKVQDVRLIIEQLNDADLYLTKLKKSVLRCIPHEMQEHQILEDSVKKTKLFYENEINNLRGILKQTRDNLDFYKSAEKEKEKAEEKLKSTNTESNTIKNLKKRCEQLEHTIKDFEKTSKPQLQELTEAKTKLAETQKRLAGSERTLEIITSNYVQRGKQIFQLETGLSELRKSAQAGVPYFLSPPFGDSNSVSLQESLAETKKKIGAALAKNENQRKHLSMLTDNYAKLKKKMEENDKKLTEMESNDKKISDVEQSISALNLQISLLRNRNDGLKKELRQ